jgi:ABC-2 type transport system permease protein
VSRERSNRTLTLLRSRPVTGNELATGSLLGSVGVIATVVAVTTLVGVVGVGLIGNDWINAAQGFKLLLATGAAIVYMTAFYCVGAIATSNTRVAANGLMIALGIWLLVVLILPQLGDTLDADNQIPGGLFKALTLDRAGETEILQHFSTYENTRIAIEEASFAKHFERFAFAMTEVQDKYRGFGLSSLLNEKRNDIGWMITYSVALMAGLRFSFRRQPTIPQETT